MNKKVLIIFLIIIIIIGVTVTSIFIINSNNQKKLEEERKLLLKDINSHYNEYVITTKDTNLYKKDNNKYVEVGNISKDIKLTLNNTDINIDTKYFLVKDLDMYVSYKDVKPIDEYKIDYTYENYIYFNKNITTKETTSFYDFDGNLIYKINNSFDFKILVMDDDRYGVVYNKQLLYVNKEDVEKVYDNHNTDEVGKNRIRTLTYHFVYDPNTTTCNEIICHPFEQWESHLKYISENNYFTLTMHDLELYMDGKINIPQKSIVITIDDATIFDLGAIDFLEKYKVNATIFVITGIGEDFSYLKSEYLDLESHTENMHNQYECKGMGSQGGGILCLPEEQVLNDLKTSQEKIGGSKYFAYPFYDFNDRAISLLQKAGFNMAFIGLYDTNGYSYPKQTNKYMLRRQAILTNTTMDEFISYLQ